MGSGLGFLRPTRVGNPWKYKKWAVSVALKSSWHPWSKARP